MVDAGHTPQWLEYWELRGRVGGVGPLIGMIEYVVLLPHSRILADDGQICRGKSPP